MRKLLIVSAAMLLVQAVVGCARSGPATAAPGAADSAAATQLVLRPYSMLSGYNIRVAGPQSRIACRGVGPTLTNPFILFAQPAGAAPVLAPPPDDFLMWDALSNWFDSGRSIAAVTTSDPDAGAGQMYLVTLDAAGRTLSTVSLTHALAGLQEAPMTPALGSLAISEDGGHAALSAASMAPLMQRPRGKVEFSLFTFELPQGRQLGRLQLSSGTEGMGEAKSLLFAGDGLLYFVSRGNLMAASPDLAKVAAVATGDVVGANGRPNSPWIMLWRSAGNGVDVVRFDTRTRSLQTVATLPRVLTADIDPTGSAVVIAELPASGSAISPIKLHFVNLASSQAVTQSVQVDGQPGVQWLQPPVAVVADGKRIITVSMQTGAPTQVWALSELQKP